jgi:hypothetical protein
MRNTSGSRSLYDACNFEVPLVIVGSCDEMMLTLRELRVSAMCRLIEKESLGLHKVSSHIEGSPDPRDATIPSQRVDPSKSKVEMYAKFAISKIYATSLQIL